MTRIIKIVISVIIVATFLIFLHDIYQKPVEIKTKHNQPTHKKANDTTSKKDTAEKVTLEKATSEKDDYIACTDSVFVCESASLHVGDTFAYSDYIWAKEGQSIEFGSTSTQPVQISLWVESFDGSFISQVYTIPGNGSDNLTFSAPFEGYYRIVMQNGTKNTNGSGYGYIKDKWTN